MKKFILFFIILLTVCQASFAAVEKFSERREGAQLQVSSTVPLLNVFDDKYAVMSGVATWPDLFTNHKVKNVLRVGINPDVAQNNDLSGSITFSLKLWKWNSTSHTFDVTTETTTLALSYVHSNPTAVIDEIASYTFQDAHRVQVFITAMTTTGFDVNDVFVSTEIEVERYYAFDGTAVSGLGIASPSDNATLLQFDWNYKTGAEYYELEWVHVSNLTLVNGILKPAGDLTYNYYLNSTRIVVKGNSYRIPKIFDSGYLVYRVRAVGLTGPNFTIRKEGAWTTPAESGTIASHTANILQFGGEYDTQMNWVHNVVYGDDGQRYETVLFSDGLDRARQSVAHNTENKQAVVSNQYYDEIGRAVITDLPTPVDGEQLKHYINFNKANVAGTPSFQEAYFDDPLSPNTGSCGVIGTGFSTTSGAGKYYSSANTDQDAENKRIPDAENYPYERSVYTDDFTGRLKKQSAYGDDMKVGSGKESFFYYPSANQAELNKLFGAEAGLAGHYEKLVTVDPSGQIYVRYFDMAGNIVAEFMAGEGPSIVDPIEGNGGQNTIIEILPQNSQNVDNVLPSSTLTYTEFIYQDASYTFNYAFTPKQFKNVCMNESVCLDCVYDLEIRIVDACSGIVKYTTTQTLLGADLDQLCATKPEYTFATPAVALTKGEYQIVKKLTVNQAAIAANWCSYIDNATCLDPLAGIFNSLYLKENFPDCRDEEALQTSIEDCDTRKELMLEDLSPAGQYAGFNTSVAGVFTPLTAGATVHSVLTLNSLGTNKDWKHPATPYLNADGSTAYINGVLPQNASFQDFVSHFQPSWANSLLPFHPEYCFLQFCIANQASNQFDNDMLAAYTYQEACSAGYFKPLSASQNTSFIPCSTNVDDPFFDQSPAGLGASKYTAMLNEMNNYAGSGYSIWQNAIYEAVCNGTGDISACLANFDRSTNKNCFWDLIWVTYRRMYLELKRQKVYEAQHAQTNCSNDHIGVNANWIDNHAIWGNVYMLTDIDTDGTGPDGGTTLDQAYVDAQVAINCQTVCEEYADDWISQLATCEQMATLNTSQLAALKTDLVNLCKSGCDSEHPMGSTTAAPGYSGYQTIDEVLAHHLGAGYEDEWCTGLLISEPGPYQSTAEIEGMFVKPLDVCACDAILTAQYDLTHNNPEGYNLEQLLASQTGVAVEDAHYMICACDTKFLSGGGPYVPGTSQWLTSAPAQLAATGVKIPASLACSTGNGCVDCEAVNTKYNQLLTRFSGVTNFASKPMYATIVTNYLNTELHFNLDYQDYADFIGKCNATEQAPYCTLNPMMNEWADVMTLLAYRGNLVNTGAPIDLLKQNIVFANSAWKETVTGGNYTSSVTGSTLTANYGSAGCQIAIQLPSNPGFGFEDIVSFGQVTATTGNCTGNNAFEVSVSYLSCGTLHTATLTGTSTCMQVNECVCSPAGLTLCDAFPEDDDVCYQPRLDQLFQDAMEMYNDNVEDLYAAYNHDYREACAAAFSTEKFRYEGPSNTYYYTLFYYDRAGNLVRSVAPEGVPTAFDPANVNAARASVTGFSTFTAPGTYSPSPLPVQTFQTTYAYNTYNQLVNTTTPNEIGATRFWYDRYGRQVASQDPVQADLLQFSYVLYDAQGRQVEVGQICRTIPPAFPASGYVIADISETQLKADDKGVAFKNWVYSGVRTEVVFTVYDKPMSAAVSAKFAAGSQQNLRLRIASIVSFDAVSAATMPLTGYTSAAHYSYDVHGAVVEYLQDVPALAPVQQDVKSTQYTTEMISGRLKKVEYQKSGRDRLTHEYVYDKMGRMTEVFTSIDGGVHKSREAHYRYFDYGPMSRVEIGQQKVQAMDYTYTINKWIKAVNSNTLKTANDGGKDGDKSYYAANPYAHQMVGADVMGYTVGYFQGDYRGIGNPTVEANAYALNTSSVMNPMGQASKNMYNGNVSHTVTAITGFDIQAGVYSYDQLNRLKGMNVYRGTTVATDNSWASAAQTQEYASSYTYDKNGNLKSLMRKGTTALGLGMDDFAYNYTAGTDRLSYVTDAPNGTSPNYLADINNGQTTDNYQYNKLGQLIKDVQEGITLLEWRKGNKLLKLEKSTTKQLEYTYDPFGHRVLKVEKAVSSGNVVPQTTTPWKYTYYTYDGGGEVVATYTVTINGAVNTANIDEMVISGKTRIGLIQSGKLVYGGFVMPEEGPIWINQLGAKNYEITNYLGNVNAVVTDRKMVTQNSHQNFVNTFNSGTEGWASFGTAALSASGGQLVITATGISNYGYKLFATIPGEEYTVTINATKGTAPGLILSVAGVDNTMTSGVTKRVTFIATNITTMVSLRSSSGSASYTYYVQDMEVETHAKYNAVVIMKADYYPYGMTMPGREYQTDKYRYMYNGMEQSPEMKGNGNAYTTDYRQYDPRLGRWTSLDPLKTKYPNWSPYNYCLDNPIINTDKGGDDPITGLLEAAGAFGLDVALQFVGNMMGGMSVKGAVNNIDWWGATWSATYAYGASLFVSGAGVSAKLAKMGMTREGRIAAEIVGMFLAEITSNYWKGEYDDKYGDFDFDKIDFTKTFMKCVASKFIDEGFTQQASKIMKYYNIPTKKLSKARRQKLENAKKGTSPTRQKTKNKNKKKVEDNYKKQKTKVVVTEVKAKAKHVVKEIDVKEEAQKKVLEDAAHNVIKPQLNGYNKTYHEKGTPDERIHYDGEFYNDKFVTGKEYIYDKDKILLEVRVYKGGVYVGPGQL